MNETNEVNENDLIDMDWNSFIQEQVTGEAPQKAPKSSIQIALSACAKHMIGIQGCVPELLEVVVLENITPLRGKYSIISKNAKGKYSLESITESEVNTSDVFLVKGISYSADLSSKEATRDHWRLVAPSVKMVNGQKEPCPFFPALAFGNLGGRRTLGIVSSVRLGDEEVVLPEIQGRKEVSRSTGAGRDGQARVSGQFTWNGFGSTNAVALMGFIVKAMRDKEWLPTFVEETASVVAIPAKPRAKPQIVDAAEEVENAIYADN